MDPDLAEPATMRRGWLGAAGAAGIVGAAAALMSNGSAVAAPIQPTAEDASLLTAAQELELAAHNLYRLALDAGVADPTGVIGVAATNHRAYAEAIAGATGVAANTPNEAVVEALESEFDTTDVEAFATAAAKLENDAVATHTELLGMYESTTAIRLTASILTVEARQATVMADLAGDDIDTLLNAEGQPVATATEESA